MKAQDYLGVQYDAERDRNKFLHKFDAQASYSDKLYYKRIPIRYSDWDGRIPFNQEVETEQYIELLIPQEKFRELVDQEKYINHLEQLAHTSEQARDDYIRSERIRASNPAVQKAYEKYLMLLELARK